MVRTIWLESVVHASGKKMEWNVINNYVTLSAYFGKDVLTNGES